MVRTVTYREPEFDRGQVALLLAHLELEADIGSHGQPMVEATAPDANPSLEGGYKYVAAENPRTDWAAKALGDRQDAYYKKYPNVSRNGHLWHVRRVDNSAPAEQEPDGTNN